MEKLLQLYPEHVEIRWDYNPLGLDEKTRQLPPDDDYPFENLKWADVVMVNNIHNFGGQYTARIVGKAKEFGKFVHFDTDDLLTELYPEHRLFSVYQEQGLSEITKFIYSHSDLVTVTQKKFLQRIKPYCRGLIAVVKNAIDYNLPCWNMPKANHGKRLHIGWAGGIHHAPDVTEFQGVPYLVNQKSGREKLFWDFYGAPPKEVLEKVEEGWQKETWNHYKRELLRGFKGQMNYQIHNALPPDRYGAFYANMDIAIAPLKMNSFNDSKSEIKVAECGRYKVPLVCSDVGCYSETIINGETGLLIPVGAGPHVWVKKLAELVSKPNEIRRMGTNLHKITEQYFDLNKVVHNRLECYKIAFESKNYNPMAWRQNDSKNSNGVE